MAFSYCGNSIINVKARPTVCPFVQWVVLFKSEMSYCMGGHWRVPYICLEDHTRNHNWLIILFQKSTHPIPLRSHIMGVQVNVRVFLCGYV